METPPPPPLSHAKMIEKLTAVADYCVRAINEAAIRRDVEGNARAVSAAVDARAVLAALAPSVVGAEPPGLQSRVEQLEAAIRWALGEEGEFPEEPPPLAGKYRQRYHWRTELRRRTAPLPAQAEPAAPDESAWLIERDHASTLLYWTGRAIHREPADPDRLGEWSPDNRRALRFARRTDAECMLTWHCQDNGRVVEHLWVARATPSARPTCQGCGGKGVVGGYAPVDYGIAQGSVVVDVPCPDCSARPTPAAVPAQDVKLHETMDALVWAREWCRIAREIEAVKDGRVVIDEGWMLSWFANTIMVGWDHAKRQVPTAVPGERQP